MAMISSAMAGGGGRHGGGYTEKTSKDAESTLNRPVQKPKSEVESSLNAIENTTSQVTAPKSTVTQEGALLITRVYHYLHQEYEQVKTGSCDGCDLNPLSHILKRTAEATSVTEDTVLEILEEADQDSRKKGNATRTRKRRISELQTQSEDLSSVPKIVVTDSRGRQQLSSRLYIEEQPLVLSGVKREKEDYKLRLKFEDDDESASSPLPPTPPPPQMSVRVVREEVPPPSQLPPPLAEEVPPPSSPPPSPSVPSPGFVTRRPRVRGVRRGRGVRVRGGTGSSGMVVGGDEMVVTRGRGGRRAGLAHLPIHQERPEPRTIDELSIFDIQEVPVGQGLENALHPKRMRIWQPSNLAPAPQTPPPPTASTSSYRDMELVVEVASVTPDESPVLSPAAYSVPSPAAFMPCGSDTDTPIGSPHQRLPPPRPRQSLRDDITHELNFGSEADSDESDDENVVSLFIPRVIRAAMETPIDADVDQPSAADDVHIPEPAIIPPTATDRPWSLYDFQWEAFPNPPIPPESRRETFSESNVGPTTPCDDPYDIFVAIWDRQFMEHIASETNRYAQQVANHMLLNHNLHPNSRISKWWDTTADELYVYFALIITMGVVVKTRIEEYWNATPDIFYTPGFSAHMSINRFIMLSRCLHFNNNEDICALELVGSEAKLFKIQPVLSHLNMKFQSMYTPGQNIALDESLLQWKGWLDINQLIPNKAAVIGIKTYEICESQTGYLWRFEVHAHKKSPPQQLEDPLKASTPAIVLRLIHGLENKGYTLWMDNFYNSPCLARRLKSIGLDCVGTLRTNRKFVPRALHNLTNRNMRPGQVTGLSSGDIDVMVWRDNNRVSTISTYHGNAAAPIRGSTKPIVVLDYNIMMGGVDKKDQMLAMYPIERKRTKVWYKKLFRRLLNVSILNSYIILHHSSPLPHRKFRINLVKSLLSKHSSHISLPPAIRQNVRIDITHRLDEYPKKNNHRTRRVCTVCKTRVHTFCVGCSKTVCIGSCFLSLHK